MVRGSGTGTGWGGTDNLFDNFFSSMLSQACFNASKRELAVDVDINYIDGCTKILGSTPGSIKRGKAATTLLVCKVREY